MAIQLVAMQQRVQNQFYLTYSHLEYYFKKYRITICMASQQGKGEGLLCTPEL